MEDEEGNFDPVALLNERARVAAEEKAAEKAAEVLGDDREVPGIIAQLLDELPKLYGELYDWDSTKPLAERLKYRGTTARVLIGSDGGPLMKQSAFRRTFPGFEHYWPSRAKEMACWMVASVNMKTSAIGYVQLMLDYNTGAVYISQAYTSFALLLDETLLLQCSHKEAMQLLDEVRSVRESVASSRQVEEWLAQRAIERANQLAEREVLQREREAASSADSKGPDDNSLKA